MLARNELLVRSNWFWFLWVRHYIYMHTHTYIHRLVRNKPWHCITIDKMRSQRKYKTAKATTNEKEKEQRQKHQDQKQPITLQRLMSAYLLFGVYFGVELSSATSDFYVVVHTHIDGDVECSSNGRSKNSEWIVCMCMGAAWCSNIVVSVTRTIWPYDTIPKYIK